MVSLARRGTTKNSLQLHLKCCGGTNASISAGPSVSTFPYIKHCFRGSMATQLSFYLPPCRSWKQGALWVFRQQKSKSWKKKCFCSSLLGAACDSDAKEDFCACLDLDWDVSAVSVQSLLNCPTQRPLPQWRLKAAGPDSGSPSTLKLISCSSTPQWRLPACFKNSTIIPVKTTGFNDYRPITLTSVVMKSF